MSPHKYFIALFIMTRSFECIEGYPWRNLYQSPQYDNFGLNNSMDSHDNYQGYNATSKYVDGLRKHLTLLLIGNYTMELECSYI